MYIKFFNCWFEISFDIDWETHCSWIFHSSRIIVPQIQISAKEKFSITSMQSPHSAFFKTSCNLWPFIKLIFSWFLSLEDIVFSCYICPWFTCFWSGFKFVFCCVTFIIKLYIMGGPFTCVLFILMPIIQFVVSHTTFLISHGMW